MWIQVKSQHQHDVSDLMKSVFCYISTKYFIWSISYIDDCVIWTVPWQSFTPFIPLFHWTRWLEVAHSVLDDDIKNTKQTATLSHVHALPSPSMLKLLQISVWNQSWRWKILSFGEGLDLQYHMRKIVLLSLENNNIFFWFCSSFLRW